MVRPREGGSRALLPSERPGACRVLRPLGGVEASRLLRHPALLAGLVGAIALFAVMVTGSAPRWWVDDVLLGMALLPLGMGALIAGHLVTGRPSRDGLADLYDSFPTSTSRRVAGNLIAIVAPLVLSAVFVGLAILWLDSRVAAGTPSAAVLGGALALVVCLGCLGVALGRWLPRAWVGMLAAAVLALLEVDLVVPSFDAPLKLGRGVDWLLPWHQPFVSGELPGPVAGFPPAVAHLGELVGVAALLAGGALLSRSLKGRRIAAAGIAACIIAAALGWAGWSETRRIPLSQLDRLVTTAVHPAAHERCSAQGGVSYCAYPAYLAWVKLWAAPVDGVLARLPRRRIRDLVVRQVVDASFICSPSLVGGNGTCGYGGRSSRGDQVARLTTRLSTFDGALGTDPGLIPGSARPPVYVGLSWGGGNSLGPTQLNLALSTAYWALGLPTTGSEVHAMEGTQEVSCLPVGQAREAIAVWLAASATPATRAALVSEVRGAAFVSSVPYGNGRASVTTFALGSYNFDTVQFFQTTGRATLLAAAMARMPARRVEAVLDSHWSTWTNWRTTDTALASALGLRLPSAPATPSIGPSGVVGSNQVITQVSGPPASPVCR